MTLKGVGITIPYVAWDTANNTGKTGDSANHTLKLVQNGTANAPANSPSEVNATDCPGLYKIVVSNAEMNFNTIALAGKSSTANVSIIPVTMITEGDIESNLTLTHMMRIILAAVAGKTANGQTEFRDVGDAKDRITATLSGGDRTAITLDGT